jgi:hypothetical protein
MHLDVTQVGLSSTHAERLELRAERKRCARHHVYNDFSLLHSDACSRALEARREKNKPQREVNLDNKPICGCTK